MNRSIPLWVCLLLSLLIYQSTPSWSAEDRGDLVVTVVREADEAPSPAPKSK